MVLVASNGLEAWLRTQLFFQLKNCDILQKPTCSLKILGKPKEIKYFAFENLENLKEINTFL